MASPEQRSGSRVTRQKEALRQALEAADRPLSFEQLLASARVYYPRLAERTVFRNIREMLEDQHLVRVYLPGQSARYELPTWSERPYFICYGCREVFVLEAGQGFTSGVEQPVGNGFVIQASETIYYGTCPGCSAAAGSAAASRP